MINTNKIKARMVEYGLTQGDVAKVLGVQQSTMCLKINNVRSLTLEEAGKMQKVLNISDSEFGDYFFKQ